jgi:hypothetical protein
MTRLKYRALLLLALCAAVAGCGTDFPVDPTEPDPVVITEPPFTGTLTVNGAQTVAFATTASGQVDVTVMSLEDSAGPAPIGPDGPIRIGIALGIWNGTVCGISVPTLFNTNAFVSTVVSGAVTTPSPLCVLVLDVGKLTEPVAFELKITHY